MSSLKSLRRAEGSKILILSVDIDDDLSKAGLSAPIVGYNDVLKTLLIFGKRKPEDSDVNAILKALSLYDELSSQGYDVDIAILAGHPSSSLRASLRIRDDLIKLKDSLGFNNIVLVSDGASDEKILPVLQSIADVISVERVIVEQSRGIEETFLLLSRYIKKAVNELPYSKIFLGVPGALLLVIAIASLLNLGRYINEIVFLFLGSILIIKGFGLPSRMLDLWKNSPVLFIAYLLGGMTYFIVFLTISYTLYVVGLTTSSFIFLVDSTKALLILGTMAIVSGRLIYKIIIGLEETLWKDVMPLIPFIFIIVILQKISDNVKKLEPIASFDQIVSSAISPDVLTLIGVSIAVSMIVAFVFLVLEKESK